MNWLLLKAAVRFVLERVAQHPAGAKLYKRMQADFCLWVAEWEATLIDKSPPDRIDRSNQALVLLQKAAKKGAKLAQQHIEMVDFEHRVHSCRALIEAAVVHELSIKAAQFSLPSLSHLEISDIELSLPRKALPKVSHADRASLMVRITQNLNVQPVCDRFGALNNDSLLTLRRWGRQLNGSVSATNLLDAKFFCRSVEDLMIEGCALSAGLDSLEAELSSDLAVLMDLYKVIADLLAEQVHHRVEQLSRHAKLPPPLSTFCLAHSILQLAGLA